MIVGASLCLIADENPGRRSTEGLGGAGTERGGRLLKSCSLKTSISASGFSLQQTSWGSARKGKVVKGFERREGLDVSGKNVALSLGGAQFGRGRRSSVLSLGI